MVIEPHSYIESDSETDESVPSTPRGGSQH